MHLDMHTFTNFLIVYKVIMSQLRRKEKTNLFKIKFLIFKVTSKTEIISNLKFYDVFARQIVFILLHRKKKILIFFILNRHVFL